MNKINNNIYPGNEQNKDEASFGRDDVNEMKLNKLINNFEIKNKINNFNNDNINQNQNEYGQNFLDLKDLIKQSGDDVINDNIEDQHYILDEK